MTTPTGAPTLAGGLRMHVQNRYVLILAILSLMDLLIPLPILGILLIYVVLQRPAWFKNMVRNLYQD
jgi:hypothetical protein